MTTLSSQLNGHRHPKRALIHAADGEIVLWCPSCKGQIARVRGQITIPRLALAEVKHTTKCSTPTKEKS